MVSDDKVLSIMEPIVNQIFQQAVTFHREGKLKEAEHLYREILKTRPDYMDAINNLGIIFQDHGKLDQAKEYFKKAIELEPDYAEAHNNLGNTLFKLNKFDAAEKSYRKAIELRPDLSQAHFNLGNTLFEINKINDSAKSYKKAIELRPDYTLAWNSIFRPLQVIKSQTLAIEEYLPFLVEHINSKYAQISKSLLSYRLNLGSPSANNSLYEVLNIFSSVDNTLIKNLKISTSSLIAPTFPKKITAMVYFGRSGTGLMHSLIDGHPEISTLPSIYFSEFFDYFTWEKIIVGGWEEMPDRFATIYDVLFDAASTVKITSKSKRHIHNIGQKEGMTNVGTEKKEALSVDKKAFIKELKKLMNFHDHLDQFTFFKLVHSAYEKALENHNEKNHIFYHIHNPDSYAQFNFLRLAPNTNWLMMVREPIQSCESWVRKDFQANDYKKISSKIFQMLFEVDQVIFKNDNSIGVRLEDLKENPKKTISALCRWMSIKENESLFQMTAQGKKWWGDPVSQDYAKDGMNAFGKVSINRKLGSVFSKNDQFILRTLFYPFSVRFGYAEENLEQFKKDLLTIRPMIDQMFDFEKEIAQETKVSEEKFMKSGPYLYLRSGMIERWNTLNKFHTYQNMITPLKIN